MKPPQSPEGPGCPSTDPRFPAPVSLYGGNAFQRIDEVHDGQFRVFGNITVVVGIFDTVQPLDHELVLQKTYMHLTGPFGTDKDAEIEQGPDFHIVILRPGIPVDCGKPVAGISTLSESAAVQFQGIGTESGFRICGGHLVEIFQVPGETPDKGIVFFYSRSPFIQLAFRVSLVTVECLPLAFEDRQFFVQLGLSQQVVVPERMATYSLKLPPPFSSIAPSSMVRAARLRLLSWLMNTCLFCSRLNL